VSKAFKQHHTILVTQLHYTYSTNMSKWLE